MPALRRRYHELHLLAQDPVLLAGLLVVGAFMLTFVVWPLGRVIVQGFFTAEGQFSLEQFHRYIDPRYTHYYRRIFYDTVRMGLLSASFGTALGLLFAYTYRALSCPGQVAGAPPGALTDNLAAIRNRPGSDLVVWP